MHRERARAQRGTREVALVCVAWVALVSCQTSEETLSLDSSPAVDTEVNTPVDAPAAPLHRLTASQIANTLAVLFERDDLPPIHLPEDVAVGAFRNQAATRHPTTFLIESIQRAISTVAAFVVQEGWPGCSEQDVTCGQQALTALLPLAWRRPVTEDEEQWVRDAYASWFDAVGQEAAMRLALEAVLQSPEFLYLVELGDTEREAGGVRPLTAHELAARVSYLLTDGPPDAGLRGLADSGMLLRPEVLRTHVERLISGGETGEGLMEFHRQWLGADYAKRVNPDYGALGDKLLTSEEHAVYQDTVENGTTEQRLELDEYWGRIKGETKVAFQAELDAFVAETLSREATLQAMLTSSRGWVSARTAPIYGMTIPANALQWRYEPPTGEQGSYALGVDMFAVDLPTQERAGILTQGAFLAGHSHPTQPSPVLRGVFLQQRLLCMPPTSPPDDVPSILESTTDAEWTTNRERYAQHTADPACAGCHLGIDGLGFAFEGYDALGSRRLTDNGIAVDTTGELRGTDVDGTVQDAVELAHVLAASQTVHDCMVRQLWRYALHRQETSADEPTIRSLQEAFWESGGSIPELFVSLATSPAFATVRVGEAEGAP